MKRKITMAVQAPSFRPTVAGNHYAVATGHYLATAAAMRILDGGGNAVDAGVTAAMALPILQPDMVSFAGVAPTLIYLKKENRVISLAGLGYWPAATDINRLISEGNGEHVPEGLLRTVMPAAPATHIEALRRYGTISFEQAATAAMEIARDGFAVYPLLASNIEYVAEQFARWPDNARVYLPGGQPPKLGDVLKQEDLGRTIFRMIEVERATRGDRDKKLRAVHDYFYRGEIADTIAEYHKRHDGFVTKADLAGFEVPVEDSIHVKYRDYEVHSCDVWCQGVVLLEALKILEGYDLKALGHNSIAYLHVVDQALNLAFAEDSYSYVTYEGWAAGRPVITVSDSEGIAHAIGEAGGGVIAEPNPTSLAAVITDLLADPVSAAAAGGAGRNWVTTHGTTWDDAIARLLA